MVISTIATSRQGPADGPQSVTDPDSSSTLSAGNDTVASLVNGGQWLMEATAAAGLPALLAGRG